jgi:hypothetical protein
MNIISAIGKVFRSANGAEYGVIRSLGTSPLQQCELGTAKAFAEDECGNYFVQLDGGRIGFWDHETNHLTHLAASPDEFVAGLTEHAPVSLMPGQVISAWIDPELLKNQ